LFGIMVDCQNHGELPWFAKSWYRETKHAMFWIWLCCCSYWQVWVKVVFYCVSLMGLLQLVLSRPLGRFLLFNHVIYSSVCFFVSICYSEMALTSLDYFIFILQYWFQDKDHWAWWQANQIANMGYSRSSAVPNHHNWLVYIESSFRHN
jgi:hypothetical protein